MAFSSHTSVSLLERAGDPKDAGAWRRIVTLYSPLVTHWCLRQGVKRQDCDEVMQETFLAIHGSLAEFRRQRAGSFRLWIRSITRYKVLDHFRRRKGEAVAEGGTDAYRQFQRQPEAEAPPEDDAELSGLYRRALDLIRTEFEARTWQAFWRSAIDGQRTDLIARDLGMSIVNVRTAKSRVLSRLREEAGTLID
jgi:RNA polymerase sigma-70 factor (ECF subfamily)